MFSKWLQIQPIECGCELNSQTVYALVLPLQWDDE